MAESSASRTSKTTSLSVLVPVYNERYLVQDSLRRLRALGESPLLDRVQIIVVDDASKDQTALALEHFQQTLRVEPWGPKFEWKFLRHEQNRGKGGALRTALAEADCYLCVFHDADLEYYPRDLLRMIPLFLEEDADAVYGSRFLVGDFHRVLFYRHYLGNRFLTFLCDFVSDLNITDMETCYKMVRTPLLKSIPIESNDFRIEPELTIKLGKRNARIFEVPISYSGRTYLEGKKIGWRDGVKALLAILRFAISDHIYTPDTYGSHLLERMNRAPRFTKWMADTVRPYVGERVLEIGAGTGSMTRHLLPRTLVWAADVNPQHLRVLYRMTQTIPYLRVKQVDIERPETFPGESKFDSVLCLNGIEHVEDDVAALRNLRDVLDDGGRIIVLVPQGPGLYGSLDEVLGHHRRYTRQQLVAAGERAGLHTVRVLKFNRASVPAWWLNSRLLRRRKFGYVQMKVLNLLVPILRVVDRWMPLPPLSLIAVFERATAEQAKPAAEAATTAVR